MWFWRERFWDFARNSELPVSYQTLLWLQKSFRMFSQHGKREEKDAPKSGKARKMGAVVTPSLTYRDPVPGSFPVIISPHPHPPSHSCLGQHKRSCHQLNSLLLYTCVLSLSLRKQAQVHHYNSPPPRRTKMFICICRHATIFCGMPSATLSSSSPQSPSSADLRDWRDVAPTIESECPLFGFAHWNHLPALL